MLSNNVSASNGMNSNFFWTYNAGKTPVNYGRWCARLPSEGNYELFAYIPAKRSTTTNARYVIQHYGQRDARAINQSRYNDEFVSLGVYYFGATGDECVTLYDNTGEPPVSTQIAFDAMKYVKR